MRIRGNRRGSEGIGEDQRESEWIRDESEDQRGSEMKMRKRDESEGRRQEKTATVITYGN